MCLYPNALNYIPYLRKKMYNVFIPFNTCSSTLTEVNVSSLVSGEGKDRPSEALDSQFPSDECFAYSSNFCNLQISKFLRNFVTCVMKQESVVKRRRHQCAIDDFNVFNYYCPVYLWKRGHNIRRSI